MATTADYLNDPELLEAAWDLTPLVDGDPEHGVDRLLDEALARAERFAQRYAGKVAEFDSAGLREAMLELAAIQELAGKAGNYASLQFSTDTADPVRGAQLQKMQERVTAMETQLLFFELEWAALEDDEAEQLLSGDGLEFCAHHLRSARRYRPHLLTEPEEKVMAEKSLAAEGAWARLFGELVSAIKVDLDGEQISLEIALSNLTGADRELRRRSAQGITAALEPGLRTRAFIFNTLVYDKSVDDRLRKYPHWLAARNLSNEASDESVKALIDAVHRRYDIPQRWYALKAKLLGLDKLADYDRNAAITATEPLFSYAQARDLVLETYEQFSPQIGAVTRRFFDESWIDAPVREHKRGGAFCAYTVPSVHPYVMLNYTAKRRDVLTVAHELGHGMHAALAQPQGVFHQGTGLTLAETASVFGETLVFERLLDAAPSDEDRLDLLAQHIDGMVATVFRQIAMNHFEHLVHTRRRTEGELSVEEFNAAWRESQSKMLGDAVEITEGYHSWWSYIPHFINTPGYVYAYAYGQLLALSVFGRFKEVGQAFVPSYIEMLSAGGSLPPEGLGAIVGVDLADPGFWDSGLKLVDAQLSAAEALAAKLPQRA
ncbi:MAG TPA: M3 family oligoendopeptidase [Solirubrobacteraceae bacterium]|nr:M3 family oligoendopeptidase [Solirubrobacteraceae bacterium]